jgi:hypothetical protein
MTKIQKNHASTSNKQDPQNMKIALCHDVLPRYHPHES